MKLNDVCKIHQTSDPNSVNDYLVKGYEIIKIFSAKTTTESGEFVNPCYVLGLKKEEN